MIETIDEATLRGTYIQHVGNDKGIAHAARISYLKDALEDNIINEKDEKLIHYLAQNEHMTPFEHNSLTMRISCPLFIRSQIHRHRTFAYNEVSRRYTSDGINFYIFPVDDVRLQSKVNKQGSEGTLTPEKAALFVAELQAWLYDGKAKYDKWIEEGVAKEQARCFLGVNLVTHFYMTGSLRNWMHFLKLRLEAHAQKESRLVAQDVARIIVKYWPVGFKALSKHWPFTVEPLTFAPLSQN